MRGVLLAVLVAVVGCGQKPAEPTGGGEPSQREPYSAKAEPTQKAAPKAEPKLFTARELYDETKEYPTRYAGKEVRVRVRADAVRQSGGYVTFSQRVDPEFPFPDVAATTRTGDAPDIKRGDEVEVVGVISQQNHKLTVEVMGKVSPVAR